jgi:hypothetical protein
MYNSYFGLNENLFQHQHQPALPVPNAPHRVAIELAKVPDRGTHKGFVLLTREMGDQQDHAIEQATRVLAPAVGYHDVCLQTGADEKVYNRPANANTFYFP